MILHTTRRRRAGWAWLPATALALGLFAGPSFGQDPQREKTLEEKIREAVQQVIAEHEAQQQGGRAGVREVEEIEPVEVAEEVEHEIGEAVEEAFEAIAELQIDFGPELVKAMAEVQDDLREAMSELEQLRNLEGVGDLLRGRLDEARIEIRADPDLRRLGLTGDLDELLGSLEGGKLDVAAVQGIAQKALAAAMREARSELRGNPELRELGIAEDVEQLLEAVLSGKGRVELEGIVGKVTAKGLEHARRELRGHPELRELGIEGDVDRLLESLSEHGFDEDTQRSLQRLIHKAVRQAEQSERKHTDAPANKGRVF